MKLHEALFRQPYQAYEVQGEYFDRPEDFRDWEVLPLHGPTLAAEDVEGVFQGLFIIEGQFISSNAPPQRCYIDLVLPERIAEHHFWNVNGQIDRRHGLRLQGGTIIPTIGIEALGVYKLYFAKEDPSAGINVLKTGMDQARNRSYLAYDLAFLLRDQKRLEEAIDALTIFLTEYSAPHLANILYNERSRMYAALGQLAKAEEDKRLAQLALRPKR